MEDYKAKVELFLQHMEEELDKQKVSISELSRRIKIPRKTIYSWLNGETTMRLDNYYKILSALGLEDSVYSIENGKTTEETGKN